MRHRRIPEGFIILVGVLLLFTLACSREEKFIGTYKSVPGTPPEFADFSLELKEGGEGLRRIHGKDHPFRWVVRGHRIRIHTEAGGTIIAHAWGDRLLVRLPGPLFLYLKKIN
ncbi:MAG: hypothetical protein HY787_08280 [Deltaproteobacteria bacterium]|nr:hypothetical protein [Deltaproteobacteria bacterium]